MGSNSDLEPKRQSFFASVISKLWNLLTFSYLPAICLFLIAALCFTTILAAQPLQVTQDWFTIPLRNAQVITAIAILGFIAFLSWLASQFQRLPPQGSKFQFRTRQLGLLILFSGVAIIAVDWLQSQRLIPPAQVTLPTGQWNDSYVTRSTDFDINVMLPSQVSVTSIDNHSALPSVEMEFRKSDRDRNQEQLVTVFQPLLVEENYWTLVGTEYSNSALRAVVSSVRKNTIPAIGAIGDKLQFAINGPKYTVTDIRFDLFPKLGPVVVLTDEGGTSFNVFMKPKTDANLKESEILPEFSNLLWLESIESAPLATMMVAPEPNIELLIPGLILIVIAVVLLILTTESSLLIGIKPTSTDDSQREEVSQ